MTATQAKGAASPVIFTYGFMTLSIGVPLILYSLTGADANHVNATGINIVLILAGARLAWILGSSQQHIYEMIFWLFSYVFMGVAPYVQQRLTFTPGTTPGIDYGFVGIASAAVLIGCLSVIIGSWIGAKRPALKSPAWVDVSDQRANILAFASLGFALFYVSRIGISNFLGSRVVLARARFTAWPEDTINAIVVAGSSMSLLVAFLAQMHIRSSRRSRGEPGPTLLPLLLLVVLLYTVNPISSPRYVFGTVALGIIAAFGAYSTVSRFRLITGSALIGLVAIFPAMDSFRYSTTGGVEMEDPLKSMTSGDFDAFAQLVNTFEYVHQNGATWGQQLLGVIFFWVPRSMWASKPIDTGTLLADFKGYSFGNLSAPIWAELYINGGWLILIVGMFFLGYAFRRADYTSHVITSTRPMPPLLGCILPFYLLIILRGSLLAAMAYLSVILVCTAFVMHRPQPGTSRLDGGVTKPETRVTRAFPWGRRQSATDFET